MNERNPWFKLYPQSYLNDADLLECTLEAEGLHARLMAISATAEMVGYIVTRHRALTAIDIARKRFGVRATDEDVATIQRLLTELHTHHRIEWDATRAAWYIPKMVKIHADRARSSAAGKKGGGNPRLKAVTP